MDYESLRCELNNLQSSAETMLKKLTDSADCSGSFDLLSKFISSTEAIIAETEKQALDTRQLLEKFNSLVSPDSVKPDMEHHKKLLSDILQSDESSRDAQEPYVLFLSLIDNPDLELSEEKLDKSAMYSAIK